MKKTLILSAVLILLAWSCQKRDRVKATALTPCQYVSEWAIPVDAGNDKGVMLRTALNRHPTDSARNVAVGILIYHLSSGMIEYMGQATIPVIKPGEHGVVWVDCPGWVKYDSRYSRSAWVQNCD